VIFETGQLAELQTTLAAKSDQLLRQLGTPVLHPFSSPLLLNHLATLSLAIPSLAESSLTTPILARRRQLVQHSIPRLQLAAQRALLSSWTFGLSGVGLSWAFGTLPFGILAAVGAVALGQRMWERAQNRFWADYTRVTTMLKGDLQVSQRLD
jgi:hypothetical protein